MSTRIFYDIGTPAPSTITVPATLTTSEVDLAIISDNKYLQDSQLSIAVGVTLGGVASATFFYYYSFDEGATWYPVSLFNTSTGEMTQRSVLVDSGTYATGGVSRYLDNLPLGVCNAFKVTGKSASGTPTLNAVIVGVRNN